MTFAEGTSVPVERSKAELDGLLAKHGASQRAMGSDDELVRRDQPSSPAPRT